MSLIKRKVKQATPTTAGLVKRGLRKAKGVLLGPPALIEWVQDREHKKTVRRARAQLACGSLSLDWSLYFEQKLKQKDHFLLVGLSDLLMAMSYEDPVEFASRFECSLAALTYNELATANKLFYAFLELLAGTRPQVVGMAFEYLSTSMLKTWQHQLAPKSYVCALARIVDEVVAPRMPLVVANTPRIDGLNRVGF